MTAPTIQPGTLWCECADSECFALTEMHSGHWSAHLHAKCPRHAVRMVTVPFDKGTHGYALGEMREVPMCGSCSEYHEAKHATR